MIIKNGRVIDPANKRDGIFDILIKGKKIQKVAKSINIKGEEVVDANGKIVLPGLIDMHVHLREPGREDIETIASGTRAAVLGGITTLLPMANTIPSIDSQEYVKELKKIIDKNALNNVVIAGTITKDRAGKAIVDMKKISNAGAIALSDDGDSVPGESLMLAALKKAKTANLLVISHCEDKNISQKGVMNEGLIATKLGLRAIPKRAEYSFIERNIKLAKKAKTKIHIAHVSTKESVDIIRKAKKQGAKVTCETAPHYFSLTDEACVTYDTRTKMNPPLRTKKDVEAIKKGLSDGTIDAIASDHAPHGKHEKEIEFDNAAFGIIGLETSLALAINLINEKKITWQRLAELMSLVPAKILGLKNKGSLAPGSDADITIIDPKKAWTYKKNTIRSKSKNSPFIDRRFKGKATDVIVNGRIIFKNEEFI